MFGHVCLVNFQYGGNKTLELFKGYSHLKHWKILLNKIENIHFQEIVDFSNLQSFIELSKFEFLIFKFLVMKLGRGVKERKDGMEDGGGGEKGERNPN